MVHSPIPQDQHRLPTASGNSPSPASRSNHDHQKPIVTQPAFGELRYNPSANSLMAIPAQNESSRSRVLPGLQYLTTIDQLYVIQKIELLEVFTQWETYNRYEIVNKEGQKIYYAFEEENFWAQCCFGSGRPFVIKVLDIYGNEVIAFHRSFACCLQTLEAYSPPGSLAGTVKETLTCCFPEYNITNEFDRTVLKIKGHVYCCCCGSFDFDIFSRDQSLLIGRISNKWTGIVQELYTDADNFGIMFPIDLDVRMKAVILGACFLIDFMYFEMAEGHFWKMCVQCTRMMKTISSLQS